ncbi:hypothetical protein KS407_03785 [Bacillus alkalicola]|uniref:Uncharacterized protein n=1 Tax=Evansella alkalicola TaxID=745819 RepID=A0ABS6JPS5_9BACI|nr:hypothetical protein [Bacillus alkalicola]
MVFVSIGSIIAVIILVIYLLFFLPAQQAKNTVDDFYAYEQEARYSSSWDMFHPKMKEKFSRNHYMQDRAHVFMNHFEVKTFDYSLSRAKRIKKWQMTEEGEELDVYKITVTKDYGGKYGNFKMIKDVFATKEEGEWWILWDYKTGEEVSP